MIGKRRDKMEVIENILKVAEDPRGANKTKLVYQSNLNFNRLTTFLDYLLEKDLIRKNDGEGTYTTTMKGREFIKQLDKMQQLL
jgi:predicted transcriptional regulator